MFNPFFHSKVSNKYDDNHKYLYESKHTKTSKQKKCYETFVKNIFDCSKNESDIYKFTSCYDKSLHNYMYCYHNIKKL